MNRIHFYRQLENSDCAATCLKIISRYYGKKYSLQSLRDLCLTAKSGTNLQDLCNAAKQIGFETLATKTTDQYLKKERPFPAILHWSTNHFVVLYDIDKEDNYLVADPAIGKVRFPSEKFNQYWKGEDTKGVALLLEPTPKFYGTSLALKEDSDWLSKKGSFVKSLFKENRTFFGIFLLIIIISALITLFIPIITKQLFDEGIDNRSQNRLILFVTYLAIFGIGELFSYFVLGWISIRISAIASFNTISAFLTKLVRLPVSYFDTKTNEDFHQRMDDHRSINDFLSERLPQIITSAILITVSFTQLAFFYSPFCLLFALVYGLAIVWTFIFNRKIVFLNYDRFNLALSYRNTITELFQGMYDLKLFTAHDMKVDAWGKLKKKIDTVDEKIFKTTNLQYIGVSTLAKLAFIVTTLICGLLVIDNKMSLGTMLAISFISGQLSGPAEQIMQAIRQGQFATLAFDRLYEIQDRQDEDDKSKIIPGANWQEISIENISFKYPGSDNHIIKNLSLVIPRNKVTAIVGHTGCGKSTLIKLLLGIYHPDQGVIKIDGVNLKDLHLKKWREQCGVVLQDGYIFSESIGANIALSATAIDENHLHLSAKIACAEQFIEILPQKYLSRIGKSGLEISGGQKQKILIARAVYKNPKTLFLDEATSSLDASTERQINGNLMRHFQDRTVVMAAHRLSTIKHADQIVVMRNGLVVELGTHEILIKKMGEYHELVSNQID